MNPLLHYRLSRGHRERAAWLEMHGASDSFWIDWHREQASRHESSLMVDIVVICGIVSLVVWRVG